MRNLNSLSVLCFSVPFLSFFSDIFSTLTADINKITEYLTQFQIQILKAYCNTYTYNSALQSNYFLTHKIQIISVQITFVYLELQKNQEKAAGTFHTFSMKFENDFSVIFFRPRGEFHFSHSGIKIKIYCIFSFFEMSGIVFTG